MARAGTPLEETSAGGVVFRRTPGNGPLFLLIRDSYRNWGFPKGHVEPGEERADAARREVAEETGLADLVIHAPVQDIDWYFRFRGRLIHKTCAFYLMESAAGEVCPQKDEGITACRWLPLDEALATVSYANAREVLRAAGQLATALAVP
ncbi:MAG TPA: NUDIX hydrolase [Gemmatimonadales bacterium]|nr:NUDIX hydrolase [Gemmatimonadales bacterium]